VSEATKAERTRAERPRPLLAVYLLAAMAVSTFTASVLSILSPFILEEFAMTHAQLGLVVALNTVVGGIVSPAAGRFVDRVGGGSALQTLFYVSVVGYLLIAVAPGYQILLVAALVGGLAQALANPATNKVIAYRYPAAERADVTGVKQSGVQFAIFLGGLTLPTLAEWLGWRWATVVVAGGAAVGAAALFALRQGNSSAAGDAAPAGSRVIGPEVPWLAIYGFLMGFAGSALFFLPLFVEEELGQSVRLAGLAAAVAGISAVIGRVAWARFAERRSLYRRTLWLLAGLALVALLLLPQAGGALVLLWLGAVLIGASASSWNSVGMLAVMDGSLAQATGAASGRVLLGFLIGLGIGPPLYGNTIDTSGGYDSMWLIAAGAAAAAFAVMAAWWASQRKDVDAAV